MAIICLNLHDLFEQAVKPLLQERTKRKVQVLRGNGRDELLQVRFDSDTFYCEDHATEWSLQWRV